MAVSYKIINYSVDRLRVIGSDNTVYFLDKAGLTVSALNNKLSLTDANNQTRTFDFTSVKTPTSESIDDLVVLIDGYIQEYNYTANIGGVVSQDNSTTTPLGISGVFTGVWENVSLYASVVVACKSDVSGDLYLEFSPDGVNADSSQQFDVAAATNEVHRFTVTRKYFRVRYVNDGTGQSYFRLQTMYGNQQSLTSPINSTIQQDADALLVRSRDAELDIANGKYTGYSISPRAGYNPDVDTATVPEDIWEVGGVYTGFPATSGETITVVSSSANDTNAAGSGARTIRISGLDASYNQQTEDFALNGTTAVTGAKIFTRVYFAQVLTSGSSNTATNAGTISIYHTTTTANVFLNIRIGVNQANSSAYTIPAGYTGYIRKITSSFGSTASAASSIDYGVWLQPADKSASPRIRRPNSNYLGNVNVDGIYGGLPLPEKTDFCIRVTSCAQNNTPVYASYDLLLIKN